MDSSHLADWLDSLGLADHLSDAGLPTFTRDAAGRAHWTDPGTGEPLTDEQVTDLDRLLHQDGSDPTHAVPVALVQLRRATQVRARLLASPWWDYAALADRRRTTLDATRFAVHKAAADHELLVVPYAESVAIPAMQFDADGSVRPDLVPVLRTLLAAGTDPWRVWGWLTEPVALLAGDVPLDLLDDPDQAPVVLRAAQALAHRSSQD